MTRTPSLSAPTPPSRVAGWLSFEEFRLLEAISETFFPSLPPPATRSETLAAYYRRSASQLHVALLMAETLAQQSAASQTQFRQLLALMASPVSGLLLIGVLKPFVALSFEEREKYLLAMANSPVAQLRQGYQAMKRLAGFLFFCVPDSQGSNPNWEVLDYTAPLPPPREASRPIQPLALTQDTTVECDAVVIGSGAGGGVVAGELALAGKHVIVLESGGYHSEADLTLQEAQAMASLYLNGGTLTSQDLGVIILAGSALGGGTLVNWCTSLRPSQDVLGEWVRLSGLHDFTDRALQESFTAVEQRIKVNTENSAHNRQNQLLLDGAKALGYHAAQLSCNAVDCHQRCGTCSFGCRYGSKQSTLKTYLQDAYDHGAGIIVHCSAETVLIENGKAVGVKASLTNTQMCSPVRVTIRAKAVIVAAGSIHTPALLLRSRLENPHIGRHLHLHPTTTISGVYPEKVYPWKGVMQSAYSDQFAHLTGNYGYLLEVPPAHPGLLALATRGTVPMTIETVWPMQLTLAP